MHQPRSRTNVYKAMSTLQCGSMLHDNSMKDPNSMEKSVKCHLRWMHAVQDLPISKKQSRTKTWSKEDFSTAEQETVCMPCLLQSYRIRDGEITCMSRYMLKDYEQKLGSFSTKLLCEQKQIFWVLLALNVHWADTEPLPEGKVISITEKTSRLLSNGNPLLSSVEVAGAHQCRQQTTPHANKTPQVPCPIPFIMRERWRNYIKLMSVASIPLQ